MAKAEAAGPSAHDIARWEPDALKRWCAALDEASAATLETDWPFWARPEQRAPEGRWRVWLLMAGRGFGKTRAGAEWARGVAESDGRARIALVGATMGEARRVMVEGDSGLLAIAGDALRPKWEASLGRLTWPNGAVATLYGAAEPETLRGPQHSHAWADEIAKWPKGREAWSNLMLGLRIGQCPQVVATTTPRPVPLVKALAVAADTVVTGGRTDDNRLLLAESFLRSVTAAFGGTRLGRQELDGALLAELEGALWPRDRIEACRVAAAPALVRVVVAVDPPAGVGGDACGIVAAGLGRDGRGYVLADASVAGASPEGWARTVAATAEAWSADRVVAEGNNGGAMVTAVLRAAAVGLPVRLVHATRGKVARAEPVAALYEAGRVHHVGVFPALEEEMAGLSACGDYAGPGRSPDRADALVWALTALMLDGAGRPGLRVL